MRVAILLLNEGRGSGEVARQHARELTGHGHEIVFIHAANRQSLIGFDNINVDIKDLPLPTHEFLPSGGNSQRAVSTMDAPTAESYLPAYDAALRSAGEIDIVFAHHANLPAVVTHDYAASTGTPYVLFLHGTGIEPRHHGGYADELWKRIERSIREASGLVVTTEYVRDSLVRPIVDVPLDRFLVLPVGIDLDEFHPDAGGNIRVRYDLPDTYVICPGALTELKGPQNVVSASEVYAGRAPTIFIGDGPLRTSLETNLGDRGRFLGFVSAEDKAELINAATVLTAAPEKKEHFGIVYIEALAAGTVPVAYAGGGVDSIVTPDVGVLTERDPARLGEAIGAVLANPDHASQLAAAGRKRAVAKYAKEHLGDELNDWLLERAS